MSSRERFEAWYADQIWGNESWEDGCRLAWQARDAEVAQLQADLERERIRLAACGCVAIADTPESAAAARQMHDDYKSASCDDVARRVDECIRLRADVARLVEALRLALPAAGYANYHGALSDQKLESLRALLREYPEETRDE